jgi:predicted nucleic acid-binding Zn finger protein
MAADVNSHGKIDCSHIAIVKASMGKSAGQTGFDSRVDVNHDGVVNVLDLATVSQKLIPGTKCP